MTDEARALAVFDLDGTLLSSRTILVLGEAFGILEEVEQIWERERGELAAGVRETREIAALLEGISVDAFRAEIERVPFRPGARHAVEGLRSLGFRIGVVSAGYSEAAKRAERELGLDLSQGVQLGRRDGKLTGQVVDDDLRGGCGHWVCKAKVLDRWSPSRSAWPSLAVGDGANDVCMAKRADLSIGVQPCHPVLEREVDVCVEDLSTIPRLVEEQWADRLARQGTRTSP